MNKLYLGDAVYVELDDEDCVVLTTEDGVSVTNRIVLEPEVARELENVLAGLRKGSVH